MIGIISDLLYQRFRVKSWFSRYWKVVVLVSCVEEGGFGLPRLVYRLICQNEYDTIPLDRKSMAKKQ